MVGAHFSRDHFPPRLIVTITSSCMSGSRILAKILAVTGALLCRRFLRFFAGRHNHIHRGHHVFRTPAGITFRSSNADSTQQGTLGWRICDAFSEGGGAP